MILKKFNQIFISLNKLFFSTSFIYDQKAVSVTETHFKNNTQGKNPGFQRTGLFIRNPGFQKLRPFQKDRPFQKLRPFHQKPGFLRAQKYLLVSTKTRVLCLKVFFKFVLHLFSTRCLWKTTENIFKGG